MIQRYARILRVYSLTALIHHAAQLVEAAVAGKIAREQALRVVMHGECSDGVRVRRAQRAEQTQLRHTPQVDLAIHVARDHYVLRGAWLDS